MLKENCSNQNRRGLCLSKGLPSDKVPLEEYLQVKTGAGEFSLLEKYSRIHKIYKVSDIRAFYTAFRYFTVSFPGESSTIAEILYNCIEFIDSIPDDFFAEIASDWFTIKNGHLKDSNGNANRNPVSNSYPYLISGNRRVSSLVNSGLIHPSMTDCCPEDIKLTKSTFGYLINHITDVSALMAYTDLDNQEALILAIRLCSDQGFSFRCQKFIMSVGILNDIMFITATLCNVKSEIKGQISSEIHKYYCKSHTADIYLPFHAFVSTLELSSLEIYLQYLNNKADITENINDMLNLLRNTLETPLSSSVLDLILRSGHRPGYEKCIYKYLNGLDNMPYFDEICIKYAGELIRDKVFDILPDIMKDAKAIVDYLDISHAGCLTNLEVLNSTLPLSLSHISLNSQPEVSWECQCTCERQCCKRQSEDNINILPLISFQKHLWLTESQKIALLEEYIKRFTADELVSNLMETDNITLKIYSWFEDRIAGISNKVFKACVCCKLNIPLDSLYLTEAEVNSVIQLVDSSFQLRHYIYSIVTNTTTIRCFIENISLEQIDVMISEMSSINPSTAFTLVFIDAIVKKYDLKFITEVLMNLMESRVPRIIAQVQKHVIRLLESMFVDEEYIGYVERLYCQMLGFRSRVIRANNDKILVLIGKVSTMMDKGVYIGNIKASGSK